MLKLCRDLLIDMESVGDNSVHCIRRAIGQHGELHFLLTSVLFLECNELDWSIIWTVERIISYLAWLELMMEKVR